MKFNPGETTSFNYSRDNFDTIEWQLRFVNSEEFTIWRRKEGTVTWVQDGAGNKSQDSFSDSKAIYILREWWDLALFTQPQDRVEFSTTPSPDMIELPVLFAKYVTPQGAGALAYTNNVVNSVVNGDKLLVADVKDVSVGGTINGDLFDNYVKNAAEIIGFSEANILKAEETGYHNEGGSIHCGTNVVRMISGKWWEIGP